MAASRLIQAYFSYFVDQNSSCLNCNEIDTVIREKKRREKGENQLFLAENRVYSVVIDTCFQNISLWHSLGLSDINTNFSH